MMDIISRQESCGALKKNIESSAKKIWDIVGPWFQIRMPWVRLVIRDSMSMQNKKRYDERGLPWRKPQVGVKGWVVWPLTRTGYETVDIHSLIMFTQCSGNPYARSTREINTQLTLSYALLMSSLSAASCFGPRCCLFIIWEVHVQPGYYHLYVDPKQMHFDNQQLIMGAMVSSE